MVEEARSLPERGMDAEACLEGGTEQAGWIKLLRSLWVALLSVLLFSSPHLHRRTVLEKRAQTSEAKVVSSLILCLGWFCDLDKVNLFEP